MLSEIRMEKFPNLENVMDIQEQEKFRTPKNQEQKPTYSSHMINKMISTEYRKSNESFTRDMTNYLQEQTYQHNSRLLSRNPKNHETVY